MVLRNFGNSLRPWAGSIIMYVMGSKDESENSRGCAMRAGLGMSRERAAGIFF